MTLPIHYKRKKEITMYDWYYNNEYILGPKDEIKALFIKLNKWVFENVTENNFGINWLGNIVTNAGFKRQDEDPNGFYCHGLILNHFEIEPENEAESYISFSSETRFRPVPELWKAILEKYAPHSHYYYISENIENNFIESNDKEHHFINDQFYVEMCFENPTKVPAKYLAIFDEDPDPGEPDFSWDYTEDDIRCGLQYILQTEETDIDKLIEIFNEKSEQDLGKNDFISITRVKYVD